jgi:hypothetical protein
VDSRQFDVQAQPGERQFEDSRGRAWRVFEFSRPRRNGAVREVLMFDCATAFRCVRTYPANWRDLPAEALETLSWLR